MEAGLLLVAVVHFLMKGIRWDESEVSSFQIDTLGAFWSKDD